MSGSHGVFHIKFSKVGMKQHLTPILYLPNTNTYSINELKRGNLVCCIKEGVCIVDKKRKKPKTFFYLEEKDSSHLHTKIRGLDKTRYFIVKSSNALSILDLKIKQMKKIC